MDKQNLQNLYRTWNDDKLLDTYKKREEYTEEARQALSMVINERNLSKQTIEIVREEEQKELHIEAIQKAIITYQQKAYENKMLSTKVPIKQLLDGSDEYMSGNMESGRYRRTQYLFASFLMLNALFFVSSLFDSFPIDNGLIISGSLFIIIIPCCIWFFNFSKAKFRLYKINDNKPVFEMVHGSFHFEAAAPFDYFFCWSKIEYRVNRMRMAHPTLTLGITNSAKETILLNGNLTALHDPPPGWPELSTIHIPKNAHSFYEKAFVIINIMQLKILLDDLNEKSETKV